MAARWRCGSVRSAESLLREGAKRLDLAVDQAAALRLSQYCDELRRWNRRINLVARDTGREVMLEKHFLDSLTLLPLLDSHGGDGSLLDVGSGAGFPGLVLAAARPDMPVILVEPRHKRVAFLRHIVRRLQLVNVEVVARRLDQAEVLRSSRISLVTGRAVAEPARFLGLVRPVVGPGTRVVLMLGGDGRRRLPETERAGWRLLEEQRYVLPWSGSRRSLLVLAPE